MDRRLDVAKNRQNTCSAASEADIGDAMRGTQKQFDLNRGAGRNKFLLSALWWVVIFWGSSCYAQPSLKLNRAVSGEVELFFPAEANVSYAIQKSTNLVDWTTIETFIGEDTEPIISRFYPALNNLECFRTLTTPYLYIIRNGVVIITRYTGFGGNVMIPSTIEGLPVRVIGTNAFFECLNVTGVTIPESVTAVRSGAFQNCTNLTNLTIGGNVQTIDDSAFAVCSSLASVTIPNSVNNLGGVRSPRANA